MVENKVENIQEKIYIEKQKIQEKFNKNKDSSSDTHDLQDQYRKKLEDKLSIYDKDFVNFKAQKIEEHRNYNFDYSKIFMGIVIVIIGFIVVIFGNDILNTMKSSSYEQNYGFSTGSVFDYMNAVAPLMAMSFMIFGFAIILSNLRNHFDDR